MITLGFRENAGDQMTCVMNRLVGDIPPPIHEVGLHRISSAMHRYIRLGQHLAADVPADARPGPRGQASQRAPGQPVDGHLVHGLGEERRREAEGGARAEGRVVLGEVVARRLVEGLRAGVCDAVRSCHNLFTWYSNLYAADLWRNNTNRHACTTEVDRTAPLRDLLGQEKSAPGASTAACTAVV